MLKVGDRIVVCQEALDKEYQSYTAKNVSNPLYPIGKYQGVVTTRTKTIKSSHNLETETDAHIMVVFILKAILNNELEEVAKTGYITIEYGIPSHRYG